jgi:hypothetical protein
MRRRLSLIRILCGAKGVAKRTVQMFNVEAAGSVAG